MPGPERGWHEGCSTPCTPSLPSAPSPSSTTGPPPPLNRQAAGYNAISGIKGDVYLATLGFDNSATTRDIGVLVGMWGGFTLLAFALMALRMPRGTPALQRIMRRLTGKP